MPISKERLAEIGSQSDETIDTSDIPELGESFFANARLVLPPGTSKKTVTLRMDEDVLAWFKAQGQGHLTRMNAVLRAYMLAHEEPVEGD